MFLFAMGKTEENLKEAFAGESQARNKYLFFAKVAREEGFNYIAKIFEETADNEMQHAKEEFKLLHGIGNTVANLKSAIEGEHFETEDMYPRMQADAEKEKNVDAAKLFREVGKIEKHHEERYKKLLQLVESGDVWKRDSSIKWKCMKCGHIHEGKEAPKVCPSCKHPKEYFEPSDLCDF